VATPTPRDVKFFTSSAELRAWFEQHHETAAELWVGFHRKHTGRPTITWQELVDQELCFGWIDSVRHSLDAGRSAQRVTPRRKRSVWSAVNVRRFGELDRLGLVHPSGRAAFAARDEARTGIYSFENRSTELDAARLQRFQRNAGAWAFFSAQAPWYRSTAVFLVMSAKREETRDRRLETLIADSAAGRRIAQLARRPGYSAKAASKES
jgi:uncharacterized protein YdeI (YjbR/CyaY-like superfamily)